MIRRRVVVKGRVQGVGYRAFVVDHATRSAVAGSVRNTAAGDVECVLEGDEAAVLGLIHRLREGPGMARVTDVDVHTEEPAGETGFRVTH